MEKHVTRKPKDGDAKLAATSPVAPPVQPRLQMFGSLMMAKKSTDPPIPRPMPTVASAIVCTPLAPPTAVTLTVAIDDTPGMCPSCYQRGSRGAYCPTCHDTPFRNKSEVDYGLCSEYGAVGPAQTACGCTPDGRHLLYRPAELAALPSLGWCPFCGTEGPCGLLCTDCEDQGGIYDETTSLVTPRDDDDDSSSDVPMREAGTVSHPNPTSHLNSFAGQGLS